MSQNWVGPKTPVIGPWLAKTGRVIDIMATPCQVEPEVWVYAFFAGAPTAFMSLIKPTPFDVATERFGGGHKKKTRRRFSFNDLIMQNPVKKQGLQWVVFRVGSWAERIGWYMLVADVAFEWAVTWSSMAYQWSGCPDPNASWGWLASEGHGFFPQDAYWAGYNSTDHHGQITTDDYRVIATVPMTASPYMEVEISPPESHLPRVNYLEFQLRDLNSGWASDPIPMSLSSGNEPQTFRHVWRDYTDLGMPPVYALHVKSDGGWCHHKLKWGLNGEKGRGISFDP